VEPGVHALVEAAATNPRPGGMNSSTDAEPGWLLDGLASSGVERRAGASVPAPRLYPAPIGTCCWGAAADGPGMPNGPMRPSLATDCQGPGFVPKCVTKRSRVDGHGERAGR
jgi:hypothetical protein